MTNFFKRLNINVKILLTTNFHKNNQPNIFFKIFDKTY